MREMKHFSNHFYAGWAILLLVAACSNNDKSIVIVHDNDVHCALDGYAAFAGLRDAIAAADTAYVFTASSGDFIQGGAMGTLSKGAYPVEVMRKVRYDVVTLGNHEFDYGMARMMEFCGENCGTATATGMATRKSNLVGCPVICANLFRLDSLGSPQPVFPAWHISQAGHKRIGWIGMTTPQALYSESYSFYDEQGVQHYDLGENRLAELLQQSIDQVRARGADYVILLSHLGDRPGKDTPLNSRTMVAATHGIDAVLDGHNHLLIPHDTLYDARGKAVLLVQCGSKFSRVGKLIISPDGKLTHESIPLDSIPYRSAPVQEVIDSIKTLTDGFLNRELGRSTLNLLADDGQGHRLVRNQETNLGDFVTDAFRHSGQAEIAMVNGGTLRENLPAGTITYRQLFDTMPYHNALLKVKATGEQIRGFLENGLQLYPAECGGFIQVSGLRYVLAGNKLSRVEVLEKDGRYHPLENHRSYSVVVNDYMQGGGDGNTALVHCPVLNRLPHSDTETVARYLEFDCSGTVPARYARPQGRIVKKNLADSDR